MKRELLDKIISYIREELGALPTNNVGSGNIAGTPEADPGNPPVRLTGRKKKYIYQKNSRKLWRQG
jgi:hypothetical protein